MPSTALLFPGQGSHAPAWKALRDHPLFMRGLELLGLRPVRAPRRGHALQQPALFLCSLCAWDDGARRADAVAAAGHSLGEYAALVAAGALTFEDAVASSPSARPRWHAAARAARRDGRVARRRRRRRRALAARLGLTVANDNAPGQVVLSGAAGRSRRRGGRAATRPARGPGAWTSAARSTRR